MGSLYSAEPTWLHRWPAGAKLSVLLLWGIAQLGVDSLWLLACSAMLLGLVLASLGAATLAARKLLWAVLVTGLLLLAFHAAMGQAALGATAALRLASAAFLGVALSATTAPMGLLAVLERVLSPLQRVGVRTERLALHMGLMLRFTEHFFVVWKRLDDAHRVRTGATGGLRLLAPLTIHMLTSARRVADALQVRTGD